MATGCPIYVFKLLFAEHLDWSTIKRAAAEHARTGRNGAWMFIALRAHSLCHKIPSLGGGRVSMVYDLAVRLSGSLM